MLVRIMAEQWITLPRFVPTGQLLPSWRGQGRS